jgi:hypothetical protein
VEGIVTKLVKREGRSDLLRGEVLGTLWLLCRRQDQFTPRQAEALHLTYMLNARIDEPVEETIPPIGTRSSTTSSPADESRSRTPWWIDSSLT